MFFLPFNNSNVRLLLKINLVLFCIHNLVCELVQIHVRRFHLEFLLVMHHAFLLFRACLRLIIIK